MGNWNERRIAGYVNAAVNLYGEIDLHGLQDFIGHYTSKEFSIDEIRDTALDLEMSDDLIRVREDAVLSRAIDAAGARNILRRMQKGRDFYLPPEECIRDYFEPYYIPVPDEYDSLIDYFMFRDIHPLLSHRIARFMLEAAACGHEIDYLLFMSCRFGAEVAETKDEATVYIDRVIDLRNNVRMVPLRGFTPAESGEAMPHLAETGTPADAAMLS